VRRRVYLLRHAEVSYLGAQGQPIRPEKAALTEKGEAQARALGQLLAGVDFDRVISSGLPRTLETIRLILEGRRDAPPVESWPEFAELRPGKLRDLAPGGLERGLLGAFRGAVPESTPFLGGETVGELFNRVLPALQRLRDEAGWDCALLVLHGAVNRALLSWALTGARTFLGHIEQSPGCINILDVDEAWVVRTVNFRPDDPLFLDGRETTMEKLHAELRGVQR